MTHPERHPSWHAVALVLLAFPVAGTDAWADGGDEAAWSVALGTLLGRVIQHGDLVDGREAMALGLVTSIERVADGGFSLRGLRVVEDPERGFARTCRERELVVPSIFDLRVLTGGSLVDFGSTLDPELRERIHLPAGTQRLAPPAASAVAELEECARRAAASPIRSISLRVRRDHPSGPGPVREPVDAEFTFGFDGEEHRIEEELGEQWTETAFSVDLRAGFRIGDLTIENSNVTVMHCSDEGGWSTLDFKKGVTPWLALQRSGNAFRVGPLRVAPFPSHSKAELKAASRRAGVHGQCEPTVGARQYRVRYRGKTIKTFLVLPSMGC